MRPNTAPHDQGIRKPIKKRKIINATHQAPLTKIEENPTLNKNDANEEKEIPVSPEVLQIQ